MDDEKFLELFEIYQKTGINHLDDYAEMQHVAWEVDDLIAELDKRGHRSVDIEALERIEDLFSGDRLDPSVALPEEDIKKVGYFTKKSRISLFKRKEDTINQKSRNYPEYQKWRVAVFERDQYTCQRCGRVGGVLNAHHIKPYKKNPKLREVVDNGVTLCQEPCHKMAHKFGWPL